MTRKEIHNNVIKIRNYYFSIQNKIDYDERFSKAYIDAESHNKLIDETVNAALNEYNIFLVLDKYKL